MRLLSLIVVGIFLRSTECLALEGGISAQPSSSSIPLEHPYPFDLTNPTLIFISGKDEYIHVMNYITQQEVTRIKVESSSFMRFTPDGQNLLVWDQCNHTINMLNTHVWQQSARSIAVGQQTRDLKIVPNNQYALGVHCCSNSASIINLHTLEKEKDIKVGRAPSSIQLTLDGKYALITNYWDCSISVISLQMLLEKSKNIPLIKNPFVIQMSLDGQYAFVTHYNDNSISVINLETLQYEKDIKVAHNASLMQMTLDGQYILVAYPEINSIGILKLYPSQENYKTVNLPIRPHLLQVLNERYALTGNCECKELQMINIYTGEVTSLTLDFYPYHITTFPLSAVEMLKKKEQQNNLFRLQRQNGLTDIVIMREY